MMRCKCGGNIIKYPNRDPHYGECLRCKKTYTWKEYRSLQADKLIEAFGKRIRKE